MTIIRKEGRTKRRSQSTRRELERGKTQERSGSTRGSEGLGPESGSPNARKLRTNYAHTICKYPWQPLAEPRVRLGRLQYSGGAAEALGGASPEPREAPPSNLSSNSKSFLSVRQMTLKMAAFRKRVTGEAGGPPEPPRVSSESLPRPSAGSGSNSVPPA